MVAITTFSCTPMDNQVKNQPSSNLAEQPSEIQNRLKEILSWYIQRRYDSLLDTGWEKDGSPVILGRNEYVHMLKSSGYFTTNFSQTIAAYLERCEIEGAKDPEMERFLCIDFDLIIHEPMDQFISIESLEEKKNANRNDVKFVLIGSRKSSIDPETPRRIEVNLSFSLVSEVGIWKIDRAYSTLDYMGAWDMEWK